METHTTTSFTTVSRSNADRVGKIVAPEGPQKNAAVKKLVLGKNDDALFSAPGRNGIGDTYVGREAVIRPRKARQT